jgi:hypothetical protein
VRDCWNPEAWPWNRNIPLHEEPYGDEGHGAGVIATLRTAALHLVGANRFSEDPTKLVGGDALQLGTTGDSEASTAPKTDPS